METLTLLTFLICFALVAAGYIVAFKEGFFDRCFSCGRYEDPAGLRRWIGLNLMVIGFLAGVSALLQFSSPSTHFYMFLAFVAVILPLMTLRIVRGSRRYRSSVRAQEAPANQG
ncbi:MAG: hypothetical protein QHG99_05100 [Methanomicrobiales archaeon]|nr:hypothetical protein [Methanomicrobiales archaeon]